MNRKNILIKVLLAILLVQHVADISAQRRSEKRGVGEDAFTYSEELNALSPGVSWYYNWGGMPTAAVAEVSGPGRALDFYPMAWNGRFNEQGIRDYYTHHPDAKYLLAFNEPNFWEQANMTPAEVVELWPMLESIARDFDLEIVGPALNYSPNPPYHDPKDWYDEFFKLLPEGSQVDYLALHCYMISSNAMMGFVNGIAERYGKKIWLTEFCAWDDLTTDPISGLSVQKNTMVRKIEDLELNPNVYKYAWFKAKYRDDWPFMRLLHYRNINTGILPGTLTELGEIYVHMSSFDLEYYYDVNMRIPATNYVRSEFVNLEGNTDPGSSFPLQLESFGVSREIDYLINVPQAGTYPLNIRMASVEYFFNPKIEVYIGDEKIAEKEIKATGSIDTWEIRTIDVSLPAGKQRITLKSTQNTTCKISWISIGDVTSGIGTPPTSETNFHQSCNHLYVNSELTVESLTILTLNGSIISSINGQNNINISSILPGAYLVIAKLRDGMKIIEKIIK